MSFHHAVRRVGDVVVLDLGGRLVFGQGAPHILHELVAEQIAQGAKNILVNLRGVNYVDTGGLGAMVRVLATVTKHGGNLRFCEAQGTALEVLEMTRLDTVLKAAEAEAETIAAFSPKRKASVA